MLQDGSMPVNKRLLNGQKKTTGVMVKAGIRLSYRMNGKYFRGGKTANGLLSD